VVNRAGRVTWCGHATGGEERLARTRTELNRHTEQQGAEADRLPGPQHGEALRV
jgi:hypothetical protein